MPIRLTDNLMNRPMEAGSGVRGLDPNVEGSFGNLIAQPAALPNADRAPDVYKANPMEVKALQARAEMGQVVSEAIQQPLKQYEALKIADEDARGTRALANIAKREVDLRTNLAGLASAEDWSVEQYEQNYRDELTKIRDEEMGAANITNKNLARKYDQDWVSKSTQYEINHKSTTLKEFVVKGVNASVQTSVSAISQKALSEGTLDGVMTSMAEIDRLFASPTVVAAVGPLQASESALKVKNNLLNSYLNKQATTALDADSGPLGAMSDDGVMNLALLNDVRTSYTYKLDKMVESGVMTPEQAEENRIRFGNALEKVFNAKEHDIKEEANEKKRQLHEQAELAIGQTQIGLTRQAQDGHLSMSELTKATRNLHAQFGNDPKIALAIDRMELGLRDNVIAEQKRRAAEAERREVGIGLGASQSEVDKSWNLTAKSLFKGVNVEQLLSDPKTRESALTTVGAWMQQNNASRLPSSVKNYVVAGLNSNNPQTFQQALEVYSRIKNTYPGIAGQLDEGDNGRNAINMAERVSEGESFESAKRAVNANSVLTADQRAANHKAGTAWLSMNKGILQKDLGLDTKSVVPPQIAKVHERLFNDAIARGLTPAAAYQSALADVKGHTTKSTLMDPNGAAVIAYRAPEKTFGVSAEVIRSDVVATYGLPKDAKPFLTPSVVINGRQFYSVGVLDKNGVVRFQDKDYSFDHNNNVVVNAHRVQKKQDTLIDKYNDIIRQAQQDRSVDFGAVGFYDRSPRYPYAKRGMTEDEVKKIPGFKAQLWEMAKKSVKDE